MSSTDTHTVPGMTRFRPTAVSQRTFLLVGGLIVVAAAILRFTNLVMWPGVEWDENVYRTIGDHVTTHGSLTAKTEYLNSVEPYLYHPPLHFMVLGGWFSFFGTSLVSARALAVVASLVLLVVLGYFLRRMIGNWALLAMALLAFDTWMIFSNRVSWIENVMMPLGVIGLLLYHKGMEKGSSRLFILAGVFIGLTVAYKHVGVIFPLAIMICWLLVRKNHAQHIKLVVAAFATIAAYIGVMALVFGSVYFAQSFVQFRRSTGAQESRGALTSLSDVIDPLTGQYAIFIATLLLALAAIVMLIVRTFHMISRRKQGYVYPYPLLYAWGMAALVFFIVLQLRFPHYFMMMVIPLFSYLAAEVGLFVQARYARGQAVTARKVVAAGVAVMLALNAFAFYERFVNQPSDDALRDTAIWMNANVPADTKVITEESVGSTIVQPYCKIWRSNGCKGAEYIIVYTSHTQQPPNNLALRQLIASGTEVYKTKGYKETITVYRLSKPVGA